MHRDLRAPDYKEHYVANGYRNRTLHLPYNARSGSSTMDSMGGNKDVLRMVNRGEWGVEERCDNAGNMWAGFRVVWRGFCFEEGVWPAFQTGPSGSIEAVPLRLGKFF